MYFCCLNVIRARRKKTTTPITLKYLINLASSNILFLSSQSFRSLDILACLPIYSLKFGLKAIIGNVSKWYEYLPGASECFACYPLNFNAIPKLALGNSSLTIRRFQMNDDD